MNNLHIQFKKFDGPLDVLLSLIDKKKMEISEVSLSSVTETFLNYLDIQKDIGAEELADFLVIATKLLFLKSKTLLPQLILDEDEGVSLEEQLKLYRHFVQVSKRIYAMWNDNTHIAFPHIEPVRVSKEIIYPENLTQNNLHINILSLLRRLAPPRALPHTQIDKTISLKQKINTLRNLLQKNKHISFTKMLKHGESKTELIVSFLALLEMVKQRHISLHQKNSFDDILIKKV